MMPPGASPLSFSAPPRHLPVLSTLAMASASLEGGSVGRRAAISSRALAKAHHLDPTRQARRSGFRDSNDQRLITLQEEDPASSLQDSLVQ